MTTYRGHYLPVAARREVLRIYRDRRSTSTWSPWATGPLPPMAAMRETVSYFRGWLAHGVAFGPGRGQTTTDLTDQYRAAEFYLDRMYDKSADFKNFGRTDLAARLDKCIETLSRYSYNESKRARSPQAPENEPPRQT